MALDEAMLNQETRMRLLGEFSRKEKKNAEKWVDRALKVGECSEMSEDDLLLCCLMRLRREAQRWAFSQWDGILKLADREFSEAVEIEFFGKINASAQF